MKPYSIATLRSDPNDVGVFWARRSLFNFGWDKKKKNKKIVAGFFTF
jgi:hypothetical protein